jgi:hypothetical protein
MTARDVVDLAGRNPWAIAAFCVAPPLLALLAGGRKSPAPPPSASTRYFYSGLVYLVCVPGIGAAVLTAYTLFFTRESLLDKDLLVYILPIVSMVVTLLLIRKSIAFDDVPGFDRLSGLMVLLAVTFAIVLVIQKTFVGIFFGASFGVLLALGAFLFALLKWGASALVRSPREPKEKPPAFPL